MRTKTSPEPIGDLLARSSLGTRQVKVLAAGAPGAAIRLILHQVAAALDHQARNSTLTRIYSCTQQQPRPHRSRKE